METLTLKNARKILGKDAHMVSDEDLEQEIDIAVLLKDLFFDNYIKERKKSGNLVQNVP
jgi:hypothetical protein